MKLRDWSLRRWLLVIALIIVLPLVGLRLHLKWRVHRAVAEWRAAGHPVSSLDLAARQATLPSDNNAFFLLTNAYSLLSPPKEMERHLIPMVGSFEDKLFQEHGWLEPVAQATDAYLGFQRAGLDLAAFAVERPEYWAPTAGGTDQGVQYHLLARLISLKSQREFQRGHRDEGVRWLMVLCRLGTLRAKEGTDFDAAMGGAVLRMALEDMARLLQTGDSTAAELQRLRDALRPATQNWRLDRASELAIAGGLGLFRWGTVRVPLLNADQWWRETTPRQKRFEDLQILLYRMSGLADQDALFFLAAMRKAHAAGGESLAAMAELADGWSAVLPRARGFQFHYWSQSVLPTTGSITKTWVELHGKLRATDAALAVELYRLQHEGKLPRSLDDLVPTFLDAVPVEPQSEKPFELIVSADGYGIGRGTPVFSVKLQWASTEQAP